jgi:hypothetical protein
MTSSARTIDCGKLRPSARAILRSITSSKVIGYATGDQRAWCQEAFVGVGRTASKRVGLLAP